MLHYVTGDNTLFLVDILMLTMRVMLTEAKLLQDMCSHQQEGYELVFNTAINCDYVNDRSRVFDIYTSNMVEDGVGGTLAQTTEHYFVL